MEHKQNPLIRQTTFEGAEAEKWKPAAGRQQLGAQMKTEFLREGMNEIQEACPGKKAVYVREKDERLTEG